MALTRALQLQGYTFVGLAFLASLLSLAATRLNSQTELILIGTIITLLGVPHGAVDGLYAHTLYGVKSPKQWLAFVALYLIPVGLVIGLWQAAPLLFLAGFLVISVVHFSGDPQPGTPLVTRILYGGAIVVLPILFHPAEVHRLFHFLVGTDQATLLVAALQPIAWPWLIALLISAQMVWRSSRLTALELLAVGVLALAAPPLWAFTIFFCGMHSTRHLLRTFDFVGRPRQRSLLLAASLPMLTVALIGGAALAWPGALSLEARLSQLIFVGLAALTVPHMALVERVRFANWKPSDPA